MITQFKIFESNYNYKIGERVWSTAFEKFYKVIDFSDRYIRIEGEYGNQGDFLIKDFIPEIEYNANKYNI